MTEHQIVSVDSNTQENEKDTIFPYKLFTSGLPRQQDESSFKYHFRKLFTVKTLKALDNDKKAEFKTPLTWFDLTMLGLGGIIGGGIFVLSGQTAATAAGPAVVLSFVLAGLVSAFAALSYSELASMIPVAGSAYTYAYATMGELVAWIIGWDLILEYLVAAAAVSVSFSGYFVDFFSTAFNVNLSPSWTASPLLFNSTADSFELIPGSYFNVPAFSLMIFLTILIIIGIKETATFNNIMVTIKVLIIVIFILAGIPYINKENYEPFVPPNEGTFDKFGGTGILAAATVVFFAYVGFDAVSTVSQESKNPGKDVPIGILTSLGIVTVLYISFSLVLTGLIPYAQLDTSAPAATAAKFIGMKWLTILVDLGAMVGLLSVALVCITGQTRIFYAMGSDNLLFPSFATKLHPRFKTPYLSTALVGIAGAVTSAILPIDVLADLTSVGTALAFFIVNIGVTILRFTNPDTPRRFKVPGGPFRRAFVYVILGGGVSAGYAALEFVKRGVSNGELCIISDESVAPYERPALSKGYLLPEAAARLPSFHTCVGANEERLTPKWYREHGVELVLGTGVKSADVKRKTLLTTTGETISYKVLIVATGARALKLEEFGVNGSDAENVCYLRDIADANRLVSAIQSSPGGNAIVIGGGYIGMECAASLVINKISVTMVFPEEHCMARLLTPKIASYYEEYYKSRGVNFVKGTVLSSFDFDDNGKVTAVNLKTGTKISVDMVVVGIGIRPNTGLFEGQLTLEKGGIKVNGMFQSSNSSVYAIGDVAAFPVKAFGEMRRLEHVDSARKSAKHAVSAIMEPEKTGEFDYIPFFYSRVFTLSWQFFGDNVGEVVYYGDLSAAGSTFGAYWVNKGHVVGAFLEGGTKEEYEAIAKVTRLRPAIEDLAELERQGLAFAVTVSQKPVASPPPIEVSSSTSVLLLERPLYAWHATAGVVLAASIAAFAYYYGKKRRRW